MIDDKELEEMQQMEIAYKKACELHLQYEKFVILKRLSFQKNCSHEETKMSDYTCLITRKEYNLHHCTRCGKFIKKEEK